MSKMPSIGRLDSSSFWVFDAEFAIVRKYKGLRKGDYRQYTLVMNSSLYTM